LVSLLRRLRRAHYNGNGLFIANAIIDRLAHNAIRKAAAGLPGGFSAPPGSPSLRISAQNRAPASQCGAAK
jgi:hypothetical protein